MLGTVPGYREFDVSVPFLIALPIFTAMLISDGGYGALLLLGPAWLTRRVTQDARGPFHATADDRRCRFGGLGSSDQRLLRFPALPMTADPDRTERSLAPVHDEAELHPRARST